MNDIEDTREDNREMVDPLEMMEEVEFFLPPDVWEWLQDHIEHIEHETTRWQDQARLLRECNRRQAETIDTLWAKHPEDVPVDGIVD